MLLVYELSHGGAENLFILRVGKEKYLFLEKVCKLFVLYQETHLRVGVNSLIRKMVLQDGAMYFKG